jgi:hypothetical protein
MARRTVYNLSRVLMRQTLRSSRRIAAGCIVVGLLAAAPATVRAAPQDGPAADGAAPLPQGSATHDQHEPAPDQSEYPSLKITGFGDVDYSATRRPEGSRGFTLGQFVLHMASELSPRVTFFGELSFSARADAGTGSPAAAGFNTEVERMMVRFDHSDRLKVSFGRYHTPINWWNTAFHHGQWLQTTIARPEMIQFGGRFLPVHFVGGLVEGTMPAGGWHVGYQAGVGNGRGSVISRAGDAGDINGNRAVLLNLFSKPDRAYGLQFGGSLYVDDVTVANSRDFGERIVAAHVAWQKEDPEFIAEVAGVRHRETLATSATWSHAFYIQTAYRLPSFGRLWKPYYRFEHIGVNSGDAVFQGVPNLDGSTLGVRYDLSLYAAVKGEYRTWRRGEGLPRNHGGFFQMCFTF